MLYKYRILEVINISSDVILKTVLSKKINMEFYGQINNIYTDEPGDIKLIIKDKTISIKVQNNKVHSISNTLNLNTEVIYIDDPFVVDEGLYGELPTRYYLDHKKHLKLKLFDNSKANIIKEMLTTNKY